MTPEDAWPPKGRSHPKGESTPLRKDVRRNPQVARSAATAIRHKEGGKLEARAPLRRMAAISKHHSLHLFPFWFQARKWGATVMGELSRHAPRDRHAYPGKLQLPYDPALRPRVGPPRLRSPTPGRLPYDPAFRPRVGDLLITTGYSPEARRGLLLHYSLQRLYPMLPTISCINRTKRSSTTPCHDRTQRCSTTPRNGHVSGHSIVPHDDKPP